MPNLKTILEKFKPSLAYTNMDKNALDISRSLAAGNLGEGDDNYAEWASLSNDPLVVVNYVKTYVTMLVSKLTGAPFRPEDDTLSEMGIDNRFDALFSETYNDVLNDGYAFLAVGMDNGTPIIRSVDARYILFNGSSPTLCDSTDVIIFEVIPCSVDEDGALLTPSFLSAYVNYDPKRERVKVSHYHKDKNGNFVLDIYDKNPDKPQNFPLKGLNRIPVIRFVGDKVELTDKKYHYRGIYFMVASVLKALALSGTKIQVRTAASDDANYIVRADAIANHEQSWENSGAKTIDNVDTNGNDIPPVQFPPKDNEFLIKSFELWKTVISDMLGPVVQSGSEAVTREEVQAREEIKDAISNLYLTRITDSISEVYRVIVMLHTGKPAKKVVVLGGYIDNVRKKKQKAEVGAIYQMAKESGANTSGFMPILVKLSDLPSYIKDEILEALTVDPMKTPQVLQLQQQVAALDKTIQQQNIQIALLRLQATQRLERQKEFIDSTERTKRLDIALKQWTEEQKQTHEANMVVLEDCLAKGDYEGAISLLEQIKAESNPIITDEIINLGANAFSDENNRSVQQALSETGAPPAQPTAPQGMPVPASPQPYTKVVPNQQDIKQSGNITGPAPRPAVTPFNDV